MAESRKALPLPCGLAISPVTSKVCGRSAASYRLPRSAVSVRQAKKTPCSSMIAEHVCSAAACPLCRYQPSRIGLKADTKLPRQEGYVPETNWGCPSRDGCPMVHRRMLHGLRDIRPRVEGNVFGSRRRGSCCQDECPKPVPFVKEAMPLFSRDHNAVILIFQDPQRPAHPDCRRGFVDPLENWIYLGSAWVAIGLARPASRMHWMWAKKAERHRGGCRSAVSCVGIEL